MVYLGKVAGVGATTDGMPFAVYCVSESDARFRARVARICVSESDARFRARVARIVEDGPCARVNIGPVVRESLTEEQRAQAPWIFYDGMILHEEAATREVLVSNGIQTERMRMLLDDFTNQLFETEKAMETAMRVLGPEADKFTTPRIAGSIDECGRHNLAVVTKDGYFHYHQHTPLSGVAEYVSTYTGKYGSDELVIPQGEVKVPMGSTALLGKTAQELADNMYDWVDPSLVVCTAAALWNPDKRKFELAVRNLHKDVQ